MSARDLVEPFYVGEFIICFIYKYVNAALGQENSRKWELSQRLWKFTIKLAQQGRHLHTSHCVAQNPGIVDAAPFSQWCTLLRYRGRGLTECSSVAMAPVGQQVYTVVGPAAYLNAKYWHQTPCSEPL